jgi:hypothetical protein
MWESPFKSLPNDLEDVWIRVISVYGELTLAKYSESNQTFTVLETNLIIPAYIVSRWTRTNPSSLNIEDFEP